jgi:hypothetical protein
MKKSFLISFLPLISISLLWMGCEKKQSVSKEKSPIEIQVPEEKEPSKETSTDIEDAEIVERQEETVPVKDKPVADNQPYEGSATLKRYIDDSPD